MFVVLDDSRNLVVHQAVQAKMPSGKIHLVFGSWGSYPWPRGAVIFLQLPSPRLGTHTPKIALGGGGGGIVTEVFTPLAIRATSLGVLARHGMLQRLGLTASGFRPCRYPNPYHYNRRQLHRHHQPASTSTSPPSTTSTSGIRLRPSSHDTRWTLEIWLAFVGIPLGLTVLLVEAYMRTELQNADDPVSCSYGPTSIQIQPHHVQQLLQNGIVVLPNVIPDSIIHQAQREGKQQFMTCMERSANDTDVRQDFILWVHDSQDRDSSQDHSTITTQQHSDKDDHENEYNEPSTNHKEIALPQESLLHCIRFVRGVDYALEEAGYYVNTTTATANTNTTRGRRVVPQQCQLAFYPGNQQASYTRHLDTCIATIYELGLLEWWRLSDYRQRVVTVILYLNDPDRSTDDGGALRCWIKRRNTNDNNHHQDNDQDNDQDSDDEQESSFDITPKGGTLVIFQSDLVEHMVMPSNVDRYALTNWISDTTQWFIHRWKLWRGERNEWWVQVGQDSLLLIDWKDDAGVSWDRPSWSRIENAQRPVLPETCSGQSREAPTALKYWYKYNL